MRKFACLWLAAWMLLIPAQAQSASNLRLGVMDDAAMLFGRVASPDDLLGRAKDLHASWVRINVYPQRIRASWRRYDTAIEAARQHGVRVELTLSCNGNWDSSREFAFFVAMVIKRYPDLERIALCNEPNHSNRWLKPFDGLSRAETYRQLYFSGYSAAKLANRAVEVKWGELSGANDPIGFMRSALGLDSTDSQVVVTNCLAYHPYQTENPGKDVSTDTRVGIGGLWRVEEVIDQAYVAGRLRTPSGGKPPICLTEFGYQSRPRGRLADRELSDGARAAFLPKYAQIACDNPRVEEILLYQIFPSPQDWPGDWDTSLIDSDGTTDAAYRAIRQWVRENPQCIAGV